jgi:hypothetical protein
MADTRKQYMVATPIPGFQAGQGRMNQKKQSSAKVGDTTYRMHATIERIVNKTKWKRVVDNFHISVYNGETRLNGCHWTYKTATDSFGCNGWEKALPPGWDPTVTGKASTMASGLKGTFGSTAVDAAGSNIKG